MPAVFYSAMQRSVRACCLDPFVNKVKPKDLSKPIKRQIPEEFTVLV